MKMLRRMAVPGSKAAPHFMAGKWQFIVAAATTAVRRAPALPTVGTPAWTTAAVSAKDSESPRIWMKAWLDPRAQRNRGQIGGLKPACSKNKRLNAPGKPSGQRRRGRSAIANAERIRHHAQPFKPNRS